MRNRLAGHQFYLSGPIDRVPDRGVIWRKDLKDFLWTMNIGVLDPCDKPINFGTEDDENVQWRNESKARAKHLYEKGHKEDADNICESIAESMKMIVAADLRMLDMCHAVILHINMNIHTCGTYAEMTYACLEKKPIIIHCEQGKMGVPDWVMGVVPHELIFSTWSEVKYYIRHIAYDDNIKHFKRWRFFDFNKVYNREIF
jgi:nucleoside 2-deoxyribosyltransferase